MTTARILFASLTIGIALSVAAPAAFAATVTCESRSGGYNTCPVDTSGGVTLSRQLSSEGCWEGDSWGYDRNRIWVNNGCRAQFRVGQGQASSSNGNAAAAALAIGLIGAAIIAGSKDRNDRNDNYTPQGGGYQTNNGGGGNNWGGPRDTFECGSSNNSFTYCDNARVRGQVEVYRQLSNSRCVYGQSWGVDSGRVWVDRGCRAQFAVY